MAAVLLYFRHDLWRIVRASLRALRDPAERSSLDARLGLYIVLGTIPIAVFGLVFSDQIENGARDLTLIGCTMIVLGLLLLAADKTGQPRAAPGVLHAPRRHRSSASPRPRRSCRACRARAPR